MVQQAFDAGIKAYGAGKNEEALRAFEAAMRGGLPSAQMPRMLYYRGLTFRKLGKPGFAVSDLTSALWLKNGLSEAERADAIKVRALAYQRGRHQRRAGSAAIFLRRSAGASRSEQHGARRRRRRWPAVVERAGTGSGLQRARSTDAVVELAAASAVSSRACSVAARQAKKSRPSRHQPHRIDRRQLAAAARR